MAHRLEIAAANELEAVATRTFDAPRDLVWECHTKPELVRRNGETLPVLLSETPIVDREGRLDVRIGPLVGGAGARIVKGLDLPGGTSLSKLASEMTIDQQPEAPEGEPAEYLIVGIDK